MWHARRMATTQGLPLHRTNFAVRGDLVGRKLAGIGEQRCEDDPPGSRQAARDRHGTPLLILSGSTSLDPRPPGPASFTPRASTCRCAALIWLLPPSAGPQACGYARWRPRLRPARPEW